MMWSCYNLWLCSSGVILYNTATPYPSITRIPYPRTLANDLSICITIANFLSYVYIMEWLDFFANFLSILYTILLIDMFSLLPMREGKLSYILTILVKYTKYLSPYGEHTILTYV